jgi:molybdate transport system substrate-binding protein
VRRRPALLLLVAVLAGCGGTAGAGSPPKPALTVSAATSLKKAFTAYGAGYGPATVRLAFGGSDELAAQIRQGVRPDVFAAANTKLPGQLFADGLVERPRVFAGNELVLAVPSGKSGIASIEDLARPKVKLAIGAASVPVGAYTRKVLARLPAAQRRAILAHVRSNEPDVGGVVGKLTQGAADAGFVYVTDVKAAAGRLKAIHLPARLQPKVTYGVAILKGTKQHAVAERFVAGLVDGDGQAALRAAGFAPPP